MEIARLPCGLVVDLGKGECCKRSCPDPAKRNCDTRQPDNAIERCYNRLKAREYEQQAELESGDVRLELLRSVCRLRQHRWVKRGERLRECSRCGALKKMEPPDKEANDGVWIVYA